MERVLVRIGGGGGGFKIHIDQPATQLDFKSSN
jgi:hypothetical protein